MKRYLFCLILTFQASLLFSQEIERTVRERLTSYFSNYTTVNCNIGRTRLDSIRLDFRKKELTIFASPDFACQPFRPNIVTAIYRHISQILPGPVNNFRLTLITDGRTIESLIPNSFRERKKDRSRLFTDIKDASAPWVENISRPFDITRGLSGRHIALWQSHGKYYANRPGKWVWQRPRLFCTTEDLFTQSILLPYVVPMLERAGANLILPRERDIQKHEVIVDNVRTPMTKGVYVEVDSKKSKWETAPGGGFQYTKPSYSDGENPFSGGDTRIISTEKKADRACAEWLPDIPESGYYGVYVSYRSFPNSVKDAKYMVFHTGGITEFKVNQQMGSGTWTYLGSFYFDKGSHNYGMVVLTNESKEKGVVCADAVRFGGGMGNIMRGGEVSGLPRYLEGARYAAQWYGMPYEVYSGRKGRQDLIDDINVRSRMINYLSGGSAYNPRQKGLNIPIEMSMALHSDAGTAPGDGIIGTLSIFTTRFNDGKLAAGTDRYASRDLADEIQTSLVNDIRANFSIDWTRRQMWNKNYSETRLPACPSAIIEILSHQNFADMVMGHDPNFKFVAGRAIYKAILKYMATQHNLPYEVQPLPVNNFAIEFSKKKNRVELSWEPTTDMTEPTAVPQEYIVYTRTGEGDFDNGTRVKGTSCTLKIKPRLQYSFMVTAVNRGGESFPSEVLTAYKAKHERERVLIVNGFDRISGPAVVNNGEECGFDLGKDPGAGYHYNISLCGAQTIFSRSAHQRDIEDSGSEYEGMAAAGNSFDYPFVHGRAMLSTPGISFVSASDEAVESGRLALRNYGMIDYICGLEKDESTEKPQLNLSYKTFRPEMQHRLREYCLNGGNLLVSGAYIASDMSRNASDRAFLQQVLKVGFAGTLPTPQPEFTLQWDGQLLPIACRPNERQYAVAHPDCLAAAEGAFPMMLFGAVRTAAGVAYDGGDYKSITLSVPFEVIPGEGTRMQMMESFLHFLLGNRK